MSNSKALVREWLDLTAMGPAEGWVGKAADDLVVRLPYAPPGVAAELRGFAHARETLSHHWGNKRSFDWCDVVILATEDPDLFVTTARSAAVMLSGEPYGNRYVMFTRLRDGLVVEHIEYFDPLPIVEMLAR